MRDEYVVAYIRTFSDGCQVINDIFSKRRKAWCDMEIGARIAQIREDAGLTQSALARTVGTSQSAISAIEAGDRNPSYEMLRQIADALGVTPAYLVGAEIEGLRPDEEVHFRQFRSLPPEARDELAEFAAYLRHKHGRPMGSE